MTKLGGCINELQLDLFKSRATSLWEQGSSQCDAPFLGSGHNSLHQKLVQRTLQPAMKWILNQTGDNSVLLGPSPLSLITVLNPLCDLSFPPKLTTSVNYQCILGGKQRRSLRHVMSLCGHVWSAALVGIPGHKTENLKDSA